MLLDLSHGHLGEFKQVGFNVISNYDHKKESQSHFYFDRKILDKEDIFNRLVRKAQAYKSSLLMSTSEEGSLYDSMFEIDYKTSIKVSKTFFSDLSFSYITWRLIEQLENKEISCEDLD